MPWIGLLNGKRLIPEETPDGTTVTCPTCESEMFPRGPTVDGKARHFAHKAGDYTGCSGGDLGESDTHRKWKSLVLSSLRQWFSEQIEHSEPEVTLDVDRTTSPVDIRRADVFVEFEPEHPVLGKGLIVEVQHKNRAKDIESVNHDYTVLGYSIYWAGEPDFTDDRFKVHKMIEAFQTSVYSGTQEGAYIASKTTPLRFDPLPENDESGSNTGSNEPKAAPSSRRSIPRASEFTKRHDEIPTTDADGHVVPHLPDCNHNFSFQKRGRANGYRCTKCEVEFIRHESRTRNGSLNFEGVYTCEMIDSIRGSQIRKAAFRDPEEEVDADDDEWVPHCEDRIWKIDRHGKKCACVVCGMVYPYLLEDLQEMFTD